MSHTGLSAGYGSLDAAAEDQPAARGTEQHLAEPARWWVLLVLSLVAFEQVCT